MEEEYVICDRCEKKVPADMAVVCPALPGELGYDGNGFPVRGGGKVVVCPECAGMTMKEGEKLPPSGEIDMGEGGLFRPAVMEEWVLLDPDRGEWELHGDHIVFGKRDLKNTSIEYQEEEEQFIARGVYLRVRTDDPRKHPEEAGWLDYTIG